MDVDPLDTPVAEAEYEPQGPRPIKKLSNDVINQIAAAEVCRIYSFLTIRLLDRPDRRSYCFSLIMHDQADS
jgi:hypothetical protein